MLRSLVLVFLVLEAACTTSGSGCPVCAAHETCLPGHTTCSCADGFEQSGSQCVDVDECEAGTDSCDPNATCTNTPGSYSCACNSGYSGNGTTCTAVDACAAGMDTCDPNATCASTGPGTYNCTCNSGYTGDGTNCALATDGGTERDAGSAPDAGPVDAGPEADAGSEVDAGPSDPCTDGAVVCDPHATCTETSPTTATCTCNAGYVGNGMTCSPNQCLTNNGGCAAGETCTPTSTGAPQCTGCGSSQQMCEGACTDTSTDPANCGQCGFQCVSGFTCGGGQCSGSLTGSATTTTSGYFGDNTGSPFGPDECPTGEALIGFSGDDGGNIDQIWGDCGVLTLTYSASGGSVTVTAGAQLADHGINATNPFTADCPSDQVATGVSGYYDVNPQASPSDVTQGVHQFTVICAGFSVAITQEMPVVTLTSSSAGPTASTNYNLSQSSTFDFQCNPGDALNEYSGAAGYWIDALQFDCYTPTP